MRRISGWLLPSALALGQLLVWPGLPLLTGDAPAAPAVATGLAATIVVAVALVWRRSAPPATLGVVAGALTVGTYGVPEDALLVIATADLVVLFSVAVWRSQRVTLIAAAAVFLWQIVLLAAKTGIGPDYPLEVVIAAVGYAVVVAFGRARHRWHAERAAAADRLAEAEERRARAADTERHRLARELHDVTAHHLTSIVVIASAAQRLGGSRPDLVAEARAFAARTGRDTLAALHRLVALLQLPDERPGPVAARLADLAEGFRLLGQQVTVQVPPEGELPSATADAVCGITREALTNTLRYAPGAAVDIKLTVDAGGRELTVDDNGARGDGLAGVGSGRGIAGMRERATALGGTLSAGPRPGGGWRVRAVLPEAVSPTQRLRIRADSAHLIIDLALVALALVLPLGGLLAELSEPGGAGTPVPLLMLVTAAHAVPLIWRRSHPWAVLGAVAATAWILPLLIATDVLVPEHGWVIVTGLGAEFMAVYAVARYARRSELTALSILVALASAVLATGVTLALDPAQTEGEDIPAVFVVAILVLIAGCPLGLPILGSWLAGYLVRHRHAGIAAREHDAVATSTAAALMAAEIERSRVAGGLRAAVLRDTARVATAADAGDLDEVLTSARAALDAMRGLLNGLRSAPAQTHDPQPTAAALPALADRWRSGGRSVALEVVGAGRVLPADVDLSVFRVVELLLAGDTGPVTVRVDLTGDPVRVAMRPMPADEGGEIAAGLRARLAAVGGAMVPAPDGLPELLLPAPAVPAGGLPAGGLPERAPPVPVLSAPVLSAGASYPGGTGPDEEVGGQGESMPAGSGPERPAGNDEEVASSPSG